jgi:hypothetical protein
MADPAPTFSGSILPMSSMRVASMATSWVALAMAIISAQADMATMPVAGSSRDSAKTPTAMTVCIATIHERRCPNQRVSSGRRTLSTMGAHNMLKA